MRAVLPLVMETALYFLRFYEWLVFKILKGCPAIVLASGGCCVSLYQVLLAMSAVGCLELAS